MTQQQQRHLPDNCAPPLVWTALGSSGGQCSGALVATLDCPRPYAFCDALFNKAHIRNF